MTAWRARLLTVMLPALLAACAPLSPQERTGQAAQAAAMHGWEPLRLDAGAFVLAAWAPPATPPLAATLVVYIEGDGFAWESGTRPSTDPTPMRPIALRMALGQPSAAMVSVAYLARPCQYVSGASARGCDLRYWTSHRFAPEVIAATQRALDQLKARAGADRLVLVGYSGGAAVAALAAADRKDVAQLITVAGNLDHAAWTARLGLLPLSGSLNAADAWSRLATLPQLHLVGDKDTVISERDLRAYTSRFARPGPPVRVVAGFDHACCWVEQWPRLWAEAAPAR